jgi:hypothetical protein
MKTSLSKFLGLGSIILLVPFLTLAKEQWELKSSKVDYKVTYTFKTFVGTSNTSKGKGICKEQKCQFLVAALVKEFNSEDSNRDSRVVEVSKAGEFPLIKLSIEVAEKDLESNFKSDIKVEFAGKTHEYKNVEFKVDKKENVRNVSFNFDILLSDFSVERPKLLTIPIDDKVPVQVTSEWM